MRKLLSVFSVIVLLAACIIAATYQPAIPTRLFDVRSANGIVDTGVTYPRATVIVFKDNAAKDAMIDAFAAEYGYQANIQNGAGATIPNPQNKQAFFNEKLTGYLKDIYKANKLKAAAKTATDTATTSADAELP